MERDYFRAIKSRMPHVVKSEGGSGFWTERRIDIALVAMCAFILILTWRLV